VGKETNIYDLNSDEKRRMVEIMLGEGKSGKTMTAEVGLNTNTL